MPIRPTSILVVGLPAQRGNFSLNPQDVYGGFHTILEPLKEKIRVSDSCYLFDSDEGYPFIPKVMDYCLHVSALPGNLQFPVVVAELGDFPITTIRLPGTATEWLESRGIRCRQGAI